MSENIKPLSKPLPKEAPRPRQPLTFTEGFNFGLGFWIAGFVFFVFGVPILTVIAVVILAVLGGK